MDGVTFFYIASCAACLFTGYFVCYLMQYERLWSTICKYENELLKKTKHIGKLDEELFNLRMDSYKEEEKKSCDKCAWLKYISPSFDQPFPELWCAMGHWDGVDSTDKLSEEINCDDFYPEE